MNENNQYNNNNNNTLRIIILLRSKLIEYRFNKEIDPIHHNAKIIKFEMIDF